MLAGANPTTAAVQHRERKRIEETKEKGQEQKEKEQEGKETRQGTRRTKEERKDEGRDHTNQRLP